MPKSDSEPVRLSQKDELDVEALQRELAKNQQILKLIIASLERAKVVRRKTLESEFSI